MAAVYIIGLLVVGDHIMGENSISGRFGSGWVVCSFVDTKAHWEEKGYKFHEIYPSESSEKQSFPIGDGRKPIKEEQLSPLAQNSKRPCVQRALI